MLVISTFPENMLDWRKKGSDIINFSTNLNLLKDELGLAHYYNISRSLFFKVKMIITCILRPISEFQRRELGVLGSVTCVLHNENIFSATILKRRLRSLYPANFMASASFMKKCQIFQKSVEKSIIFCKNF